MHGLTLSSASHQVGGTMRDMGNTLCNNIGYTCLRTKELASEEQALFGTGAGPEDRALRGRNPSAEAGAKTAGAEPSGSRLFQGGLPDGRNAKNPGGFGGQRPPLYRITSTASVFHKNRVEGGRDPVYWE